MKSIPARLLSVVTWVASLLVISFLEVHVTNDITLGLELGMDKIVRLTNVVKRPVLRWPVEATPTHVLRHSSELAV